MQLGIRLHDTINLPIEERLAHVRSLGFACGHMALGKVISEYSTGDEALTPGMAMYLRRQFAKNDLDCAVLGCYLDLSTTDPEKLAQVTKRYLAHIRFASLLGCGVVGTETGVLGDRDHEEMFQTFLKNLRPVVEYAEKMGVIIAIEPVYCGAIDTPATARRMLDTIQSPNLQIILDPVNLLGMHNYQNEKAVIDEAIALLGPDIAVIHIKDYKVVDGKMHAVGAGLGQMDYTSLIRFMKEKKPFIHATLENTTPENHVQCREIIQKLYDEA